MTPVPRQAPRFSSSFSRWVIPALVFALLGLLALPWIPLPADTKLWKALHEFGHVPMYGGVALVLLFLIRFIGSRRGWSSATQYALSLTGAIFIGWMSEGMQAWMEGRTSEWSDVLRDAVGAVCALGLFLTWDPALTGRLAVWGRAPRKYLIYAGVGILMLIVLTPVFVSL